jgi:hypothetical protein
MDKWGNGEMAEMSGNGGMAEWGNVG